MTRMPAAAAGLAVLCACATPEVSFAVDVPKSILAEAAWIEVGAFAGGCPSTLALAGGLPYSGLAGRVAFAPGAPRAMGRLAAGVYGFAAVVRAADCRVLAAGCASADVSRARDVHVSTRAATSASSSACAEGTVCSSARCVPPAGGQDPSFGADCSMQLVGAGPLPPRLSLGTTQVSGPAVVSLGDGFVVSYMEYDQSDGAARLTVVPLDSEGGTVVDPETATFSDYCVGAFGGDAVALALRPQGAGLLVSARPTCPSKSGYELFEVGVGGALGAHGVSLAGQAPGPKIALSGRALALGSSAGSFVLASRVGGVSALATSDGKTLGSPRLFGDPADVEARVARGSGVQIVSAEGPGKGAGDAGAPAGLVARVHLSSASASPTAFSSTPDDQVPMTISTIAATGARALLITDGGFSGGDLNVRSYDLARPQSRTDASLGVAGGTGRLVAIDAVALGDRLFMIAARSRAMTVLAVPGAASTLDAFRVRQASLSDDLRIPGTYVDGAVAIAATAARVAVVWSSRRDPMTPNDAVGGYAVFACR